MSLEELKKSDSVISLGGGAFLNNAIRRAVKYSSVSFWLDVDINELTKRLNKTKRRPLLAGKNLKDNINKIYLERKKTYNEADFKIKCYSLNSQQIVEKILNNYEKSGNKI